MFDFLKSNKKKPQEELVTSIILPEDDHDYEPVSPIKLSPQKSSPKKSVKKIDNADFVSSVSRESFNNEKYLKRELEKSEKAIGFNERQVNPSLHF